MKQPSKGLADYQSTPAFTLLELLVVVALIGVLASLLLPTLARAKSAAGATLCRNNLRQLAMGLAAYVGDHGVYKVDYEFVSVLWAGDPIGGSGRVPTCPIPTTFFDVPIRYMPYVYNAHGVAGFSMGFSNSLGLVAAPTDSTPTPPGIPNGRPVNESEVVTPAEMVAYSDCVWRTIIVRGRIEGAIVSQPQTGAESGYTHRSALLAAFCDGHVEAIKRATFSQPTDASWSRWNRDHQPHRELWPALPRPP